MVGAVEAAGPGVDPALTGRPVVGEGFRELPGLRPLPRRARRTCARPATTRPGSPGPARSPSTWCCPRGCCTSCPRAPTCGPPRCWSRPRSPPPPCSRPRRCPASGSAVVGAGTLGAAVRCSCCAASSPAELAATDPRAGRRAAALACGATACVQPGPARAAGAFDVVMETAGRARHGGRGRRLARRGGRVVLTGHPRRGRRDAPRLADRRRQLTITSVFGAPSSAWTHAVRVFTAGLLDLGPLVTHELPLEAYPRRGRAARPGRRGRRQDHS